MGAGRERVFVVLMQLQVQESAGKRWERMGECIPKFNVSERGRKLFDGLLKESTQSEEKERGRKGINGLVKTEAKN